MNQQEKDAALFWLHVKVSEGGVRVDDVMVPVEEMLEIMNNVTVEQEVASGGQ